MNKFLFLLLIIPILFVLNSCQNSKINDKIIFSQNYSLDDVKIDTIEKNSINKILLASYYENNNDALFSSITINNYLNIYDLGWSSKILGFSNGTLNESYCDSVDKNVPNINIDNLQLDDLLEYSYSLKLCNINQTDKIAKRLNDFYDSNSSLFFYSDKNELIENKIRATYIALNIMNNLNIEIQNQVNILNSLIECYTTTDFIFNSSSSFLMSGGYLILNLLSLNYTSIISNEDIYNWLNNVTEYFFKNNYQYSMVEIMSMYYILLLDKEFNLNISHNINIYLNNYFKKNKTFYDLVYKANSYNSDPQYIYKLLFICNEVNYKIPDNFLNQINNYLQDNIYSNFSKTNQLNLNLEDDFFGIKLANKTNFNFNKSKILNELYDYKNNLIIKNELSTSDIQDIYYFLLTCTELNTKILNNTENNKLLEEVKGVIFKIDLSSIDYRDILDLDYTIETIFLLNGNLSRDEKTKIKRDLSILLADDEIKQSIYLCDIQRMYIYLNSQSKSLDTQINDLLIQLYKDDHYIPVNSDNYQDFDDIKYSYDVFMLSLIDKNFKCDFTNINNYLQELKNADLLAVPNKNSSTSDLKTIDYFVVLFGIN